MSLLDACLSDAQWQPEPALGCAQDAETHWEEEIERLGARLDKVLGREARQALAALGRPGSRGERLTWRW